MCFVYYLFYAFVLTFVECRQQRILRHTKHCQYSLIVNELDTSQCPFVRNKRDLELVDKSRINITELQIAIDKNEESIYFCKVNITNNQVRFDHLERDVFKLMNNTNIGGDDISRINQKLKKYDRVVKSLEHKLLSMMTNVGEMQIMMDKRLPKLGSLHEKDIGVVSVADTQVCRLDPKVHYDRDCLQIYWRGHRRSGVYFVKPLIAACPIPVWCDMDTPFGGWLVISRRENANCNYNRGWTEYRKGFCNITSDFWLGLDNIFLLTHQANYQLRVDLWDFKGSRVYAEYDEFWIGGEKDNYQLHVGNYTGTAGEGLSKHNGRDFSTPDIDNDIMEDLHCAKAWGAGWWFSNCWFTFLNGKYYNKTDVQYRTISWNDWKPEQLFKAEMKIRPTF